MMDEPPLFQRGLIVYPAPAQPARKDAIVVETADLETTARLFRALATPSRLHLMCLLQDGPATVSGLVERSGLSQPLVSQHLRTLRESALVDLTRSGRESVYALSDSHVGHIVADAIAHIGEPHPVPQSGGECAHPGGLRA